MISLVAALSIIGAGFLPGDEAEIEKVKAQLAQEVSADRRIQIILGAIQSRKGAGVTELGTYHLLLGDAYCDAQKTKEARVAYANAGPMLMALSASEKVDKLNKIARKLYDSKDALAASFYLKQAIYIARTEKMLPDTALLGLNLGFILQQSADQDLAHLRGAEDAALAGMREYVGENYAELGYRGFESKDYDRAIFYFEAALAVPEWGERKIREVTQHYIVASAGYSGDWRRAHKYGPLVHRYYMGQGNPDQAAMILNNVAYADRNADRHKEAIAGFKRALAETNTRNRAQRMTITHNLAMAYLSSKRWTEATATYKAAQELARGIDEDKEQDCNVGIGMALLNNGKAKEALPYLKKGSEWYPTSGGLLQLIVAMETLERCYRALGQTANASKTANKLAKNLDHELGNIELMRAGMGSLMDDVTSISGNAMIYSMLVGQALKRGDVDLAFHHAENSKGRTLVDYEHRVPLDPATLDFYQRDSLKWLRERVRRLHTFDGSGGATPEKARLELELAFDELQAYERFLRGRLDVESYNARLNDRVKQSDMARDLSALPADTVLVEFVQSFSLNQNQIAVILCWAEKGKVKFASHVLKEGSEPVDIGTLTLLSRDFLQACRSTSSSDPTRGSVVSVEGGAAKAGERLGKIFINPLKARLGKFKRIVIIPDSCVESMPFEALPIGGGKLAIDAWEVSYSYSARQYLYSANQAVKTNTGGSMLIVANPTYGDAPETSVQSFLDRGGNLSSLPPLPGTKVEAEKIRTAIPSAQLMSGDDAYAAAVEAEMSKYSVLHFATHGLFDPTNPMGSSLAFARLPGQRMATQLLAQDIQAMKLNARLAVLSACDTGRGEYKYGEGSIGLTYAFLKAGCPVVVSSRWPVNDESTAELMADFYAGIGRGEATGRALRLAILSAKKKRSLPYYWAPFMVVGDGRK